MTRNLTVHFKRVTYLVEPGPETLPLGGKRVIVREWEDGRVEIQCAGRTLPYSIFDKNPHVAAGAIVENKRLGAVLAVIQGCPGRTGPDPIGLEEADASAEGANLGRASAPRRHPPEPDISTWQKTGHLYLALTFWTRGRSGSARDVALTLTANSRNWRPHERR